MGTVGGPRRTGLILKHYFPSHELNERGDTLDAAAQQGVFHQGPLRAVCDDRNKGRKPDVRCSYEVWDHRMRKQTYGSTRRFQLQRAADAGGESRLAQLLLQIWKNTRCSGCPEYRSPSSFFG